MWRWIETMVIRVVSSRIQSKGRRSMGRMVFRSIGLETGTSQQFGSCCSHAMFASFSGSGSRVQRGNLFRPSFVRRSFLQIKSYLHYTHLSLIKYYYSEGEKFLRRLFNKRLIFDGRYLSFFLFFSLLKEKEKKKEEKYLREFREQNWEKMGNYALIFRLYQIGAFSPFFQQNERFLHTGAMIEDSLSLTYTLSKDFDFKFLLSSFS